MATKKDDDNRDVLNFDAAHAAAAEAEGGPLIIILDDREFTVNRRLTMKAMLALNGSEFGPVLECLFGDQLDDVLDAGLEMPDVIAIADRVAGSLGGPDASGG